DLRRRVERGVRQEVRGRLLELHERDEDGARTHRLGDPRVARQLAAPRGHADPRAGVDAEPSRVARMDGDLEARGELQQAPDPSGERPSVPAVAEPAGVEEEGADRKGT